MIDKYKLPGQAAKLLSLSIQTLRQMAKRGWLPKGSVLVTEGGHHRYDVERIKNHMAKMGNENGTK